MVDTVKSLKPATAGFYSIADLFGVFANGEIWIQPAGGGWTALLLEAEGHPVAASVPEQGAIQWTETLGIFKGAKNPEHAKAVHPLRDRPSRADADRHPARLPGGDPEHGGLGAHGGGAARLGPDVERLDDAEPAVDWLEARGEVVRSGVSQRVRPEDPHVVGSRQCRSIRPEIGYRQIRQCHGGPYAS